MRTRAWAIALLVGLVTLASAWLSSSRLRITGDLTTLFPRSGDAVALARYAKAFGGGDLARFLVRAGNADDAREAARDLEADLSARGSIAHVASEVPAPHAMDPTLAWIYADARARRELASALTPEGMRARLDETKARLLAPGSSAVEEMLARDPLRLAEIPWEAARREVAPGLDADRPFVADEGRARLVLAEPRGGAFDSAAVAAFTRDTDAAMNAVRAKHPGVTIGLAGGHAIARATELLLRRDLALSGVLSLVLASLAFLVTFRRPRALLAVLPPLALGTLWTTGLAALAWHELSVVAIGFMAVVVGVGVDTGVHVYAAIFDARRAGLSGYAAASAARASTWRPTLLAAVASGAAFACLALAELPSLAQLGLLCAAGEVLTSVAILAMTPAIGAWLERGEPAPRRDPAWLAWVARATSTKRRAIGVLALAVAPFLVVATVGAPRAASAVVALRPSGLAPFAVEAEIRALFGGGERRWIVLVGDKDGDRARARADQVASALDELRSEKAIAGYDALTTLAPSRATRLARIAERDALDLPSLAPRLSDALADRGFDVAACAPAIDLFRHPSNQEKASASDVPLAWIAGRHVAVDAEGTLVAIYVRPLADESLDARVREAIHAADAGAAITGYPQLEASLKETLARALPRVAVVALGLVALALGAALRRVRDVLLALFVVAVELAIVFAAMRILGIGWHVYDALALPVLIGVTIDEAMFLLHAAEHAPPDASPVDSALRAQGALVAATALTTAAGFGALLVCRFQGLADVGAVGAIGSTAGLICALFFVPAGLRLARSGSR